MARIVAIVQLNFWPMVGYRNDHVETMDGQDHCNRAIKFLDNGGYHDDHVETMDGQDHSNRAIKFWTMVAIATIMWKPWMARIVTIVQLNFWTMVAIMTILWKPCMARILAIMQ